MNHSDYPARSPLPKAVPGEIPPLDRGRVLIVDDQQSMCEMIDTDLRTRGFETRWCVSADEALRYLQAEEFDTLLTDVRMPGVSGLQLCQQVVCTWPDIPVVVMTAFGSMETAVEALRAGAFDFITKPIELEILAMTLQRAIEHRRLERQVRQLSEQVARTAGFGRLIGESPVMQDLYDQLSRIADSEAPVMLSGESGTGKEVVARSIHDHSRRAAKPFVALNCAALPESLLESELFGHASGAFTDARTARKGLFQQAQGGTLLLDEIGEMPLAMQAKLLRVLEEGVLRPLGQEQEVAVDVRVLSATNRDLEADVQAGRFRQDLYYRINVIQLELPPLRARGNDILLLAQHFLESFASQASKQIRGISPSAAEKLLAYDWPGNVRELRNVIQRAVALTSYDQIAVDDLPEKIRDHRGTQLLLAGDSPDDVLPLEELERRYIGHVLRLVGGNKTLAARKLGLDRKTLYRKLAQKD